MPRIFPSPFPFDLEDDPGRKAERKVYNAFKEQLSPEHTIFYSRSWLGKPGSGSPVDGATDFRRIEIELPGASMLRTQVKMQSMPWQARRSGTPGVRIHGC